MALSQKKAALDELDGVLFFAEDTYKTAKRHPKHLKGVINQFEYWFEWLRLNPPETLDLINVHRVIAALSTLSQVVNYIDPSAISKD